MLSNSIKIALNALAVQKMRAALTALGVIIGVAAVAATMSIGAGAKQSVQSQVQSLGSNLLTVFPGQAGQMGISTGESVQNLKESDGELIKAQVSGVEDVAAEYGRSAQVVYGSKNTNTQVLGESPNYAAVSNWTVAEGRFISAADNKRRARVAAIGQTVATTLFGTADPVGSRIKINRTTYTVIGLMASKGSNGFQDRDDVVFVPLATAQKRLFSADYVRSLYIKVANADQMSSVQTAVQQLLRRQHRLQSTQTDDFTVRNLADVQSALQSVTQTITLMLGSVAGVALIVGGIGIMNIMLVSVTERTREIGLRKALGAPPTAILMQFLVEAIVLSVLGGIMGILCGEGATFIVGRLFGWATAFTWTSGLLAFGFAALVGVLSGLYPAQRAAAVDPIVALRYE
jgi:putative ABC transport system permease protein